MNISSVQEAACARAKHFRETWKQLQGCEGVLIQYNCGMNAAIAKHIAAGLIT